MLSVAPDGKREFAARMFDAVGLRRVLSWLPAWSGLLVLNYHRIGRHVAPWTDGGVFSATQEEFEAHIRFLSKEFDLVRLADVEDVLAGRRSRGVLITFDDGYRDNYDLAFPVLKACGKSAVFFLTTGYLDQDLVAWWDKLAWIVRASPLSGIPANPWTGEFVPFDDSNRERAVRRLLDVHKKLPWLETGEFRRTMSELLQARPYPRELADQIWMNWGMVREMHAAGQEFGGHTVTHPVLANLSLDEQLQEIQHSKQRVETEIKSPIRAFSYPVGGIESFTDATQQLLRDVGYEFGFSFIGGMANSSSNRYVLPRFAVDNGASLSMFRAMVTLPQLFARL